MNRLSHETSPYLLQHANNPVDWYPWGDEAIAKSRELNRPIFLSIGYSACHWCHVMEHESFENDSIAAFMNEHFICVKVDREERPDLDQIYMASVQIMTGHGGWPMSVFLTPALRPFFGGTYWPPESRPGMRMPGFRQVLMTVSDAWINRRAAVEENANELTSTISRITSVEDEARPLDDSILKNAERGLLRSADRSNGGFGGSPKFPHPMDLRVLLRTWKRFGNEDALRVVTLTLDKMSHGGIYDHLGGGFHRYATDSTWLVPHFEKMLYDNALLASAYLEAYQATGQADYARVVRETLDYVLREMTQPQGGFYSTQDADSEGEEGKFFVWTENEILELLGPQDGRLFCYCYDVTARGNWEGHNILNRPKAHELAARGLEKEPTELEEILARCRAKLFGVRSTRIAPSRDDKVLVSWNGLMIAAMAQAAMVLDEPKYADAAVRAADFILTTMREPNGRLLHSFKDGRSRFNAYLDDYACLIDGLVDVYQATSESRFVDAAIELSARLLEQFLDPDEGGFFYTSNDHESLITRTKDAQDNATPSGNGMAAYALLRLARLTSRPDIADHAANVLTLLSGQLVRVAMASGQTLLALDYWLGPSFEFVLVEGADATENASVWRSLHQSFRPNKIALRKRTGISTSNHMSALLLDKAAIDNRPTLYPCQLGACQQPIVGADAIQKLG
jgi:hypothetical protein